ncbi:hypothetical protein H310_03253 [Aphanomyces invadans]|uniref:LD-carboxypeptidase n=1 Tax=Aphanomyces invadans TaxID=157072 RepID=A0A024UGG1_9STRA|nr:hypothetical protein H310_03253 [Aphanomyces invadans]ETW05491.1 hypothetical protein H310_03253 [Aphanomyces invadans]|eukprot:XP_008865268.1 hypothetical protein H310_03253 [Aphanomyces invadans]
MQRPRRLRVGDTVAFVAPASGTAVPAAHRLEQGKRYFEAQGYVVKVYPSCHKMGPYSSCSPEERAQDIMDAFQDPAVKAIVCTIGGLTSHEVLEHLDFSILAKHPTIFCGFSDITTMHLALQAQANMVTFYGPSVLCQFGEFPAPLTYTTDAFFRATSTVVGDVMPSDTWSDDKSINWFTKADMHTIRPMKPNVTGHEWLRSSPHAASGRLLGGCLPVLLNVFGTKYMPSLVDCVLLIETSESESAFDKGMIMDQVNAYLGVLRMNGTLLHLNGLIVGRGFAYTDDQVAELKALVLHHTRSTTYPIVYGVDCGHSDPIATWPLGVSVTLDATANLVTINEAGVDDN